MTDKAEQIAAGLTDDERRLLLRMSDGEFVYPLANTAADAEVPLNEARKIVRRFRADGLAVYGPLYNEDEGHVCGSGTWLSGLGLAVRAILERQSNDHQTNQ